MTDDTSTPDGGFATTVTLDGDAAATDGNTDVEGGEKHGRTERAATTVESALLGDDLAVTYPGCEEPVVECSRIDLPEGAVTALVGPNGSGKSTLLKALSAHLDPERGVVALDGRAIQEYGQKELARELGHLSQENVSPGAVTVEELVTHGRYPHRGAFEAMDDADRAAIDRALDLAGVAELRDDHVSALSGGQKQLAWIAMVLAQQTDVLLLDEPTTYLDLHHQLRVLETLRRLNETEGVTVAVVLHDVAQAVRFADYLVAMRDGQIYDWGPPEKVVTEELLADVFAVDAAVSRSPELQILPRRALEDE